jgi:hypothetical protein
MRAALDIKNAEIQTHQKFMDRADAHWQRIAELMRDQNISGNTDKEAFARLTLQSDIESRNFTTHADEQKALRKRLFDGQQAIGARLAELALNTSAMIPDAIISCRQELDLPIDPTEYRTLYAEQQNAAAEIVLTALRGARKLADGGTANTDAPK